MLRGRASRPRSTFYPCRLEASHHIQHTRKALVKPLAQIALRLIAQPTPPELHHDPARPPVAGLGNALLGLAVATAIRRGSEPDASRHLPPVLGHQSGPAPHLHGEEVGRGQSLPVGLQEYRPRHSFAALRVSSTPWSCRSCEWSSGPAGTRGLLNYYERAAA